jgi:hypothetical protein
VAAVRILARAHAPRAERSGGVEAGPEAVKKLYGQMQDLYRTRVKLGTLP